MEAKINIDPHAFDDRIIEICNRLVDTRFKGIFAERTMKNQNKGIKRNFKFNRNECMGMRLMHENGYSYGDIAKKYKCSESAVYNYIHLYDINQLNA